MNTVKYIMIVCSIACMLACTEEHMGPLPNSGAAVEPVTNVQVENIAGGAIVSYNLPKTKNARYVEARWTTPQGTVRTAKSSIYTTQIELRGFPDTEEHEIELYTVSDGERKSSPVSVKIKPLTPPFMETFNSLTVTEDFGGMSIGFENTIGDDLVITVLLQDSLTGELNPVYDHYTSLTGGYFSARGFPAVEREFGFSVRDRWGNYSDTSFVTLTPIHEVQLDKSKFRAFDLPGDVGDNYLGGDAMHKLWDNNVNTIMHTYTYNDKIMPDISFSFDMGEVAKLSRFTLWQRYHDSHNNLYNNANWKEFEIWGTAEIPDLDGSWDNWVKIGDFEITKPSGLPLGLRSDDDLEAAIAGHEFTISLDAPPVRFLRIRVNTNWGSFRWIYASELTFWGSPE